MKLRLLQTGVIIDDETETLVVRLVYGDDELRKFLFDCLQHRPVIEECLENVQRAQAIGRKSLFGDEA